MTNARSALGLAVLSLTVASAALALPERQEYRDPGTGKVWTPDNVGTGRSGPAMPGDGAFNPQGQATTIRGSSVQIPTVNILGSVPVTAGPTMPIATLEGGALSAIPSQRWQVELRLSNNSARPILPVVGCTFTNGSNTVENVSANLPAVAGGQRVGFILYGPQTNLYVDRASCRLNAW